MTRLYQALLWLYPRSFRREYGADMVETFSLRLAERARERSLRRLRFFLREAGGAIAGAAGERLGWPVRPPRQRGRPTAPPRPRARRRGVLALISEARFALRRLRRSPGFALAAILTLAVGLGGNTAIFAVIHAVILKPLPYPDADRLVRVAADVEAVDAHGIEIPISFWLGYRQLNETFDEIGLYERASVNLTGDGPPERLEGIRASASLLPALGVAPLWGRGFLEDDEGPGAAGVALLSWGLFQARFGGDPAIVGRSLRIDGVDTEVVGVMPEGFAFPQPETQIWLPLPIDRSQDPPVSFSYSSIGRLEPGISLESARRDLLQVTHRLPELFGNVSEDFLETYGVGPSLRSYKETVIGDIGQTLWVLLGALGLLLLMACANVANLFLVRSEARRREVGLRAALGAGRADLVRYLLAESVVLGVLAGAVGLALAAAGVRLLVNLGAADVPRLHEVGISVVELAFVASLSLLASLAFGSLPIVRLARERLMGRFLQLGDRGGPSRQRATRLLVVAQVSLALMLLVGAVLFALSLAQLLRIDPGFRAKGVLTFRLSLSDAAFPGRLEQALFHQQLLDRLEALPGIEAAGLSRCLPLQGWCGGNPVMSPDTTLAPEAFREVASIKPVSPGYFRALGIPLRSGRLIERSDHEARTGAAVLSEALAARLFPGIDPLGKRVYPSEGGASDSSGWYTVVGVVGNVKRERLDEEPADILYLPMVGTDGRFLPGLDEVTVAVLAESDPSVVAPMLREAVWSLADEIPLAAMEPMQAILSRASARVELTVTLIAIAAVAALLLGAIGIYGVVSHSVGQRTPEIGLRMALGARRLEVVGMVLGQGLIVAVAGVLLGLAGALALGRVLDSLLYQVSPQDPATLVAVSAALLAVAAVASYLPARRAARVDPVDALKHE